MTTTNTLPPYCYEIDLMNGDIIKIKNGHTGYFAFDQTKVKVFGLDKGVSDEEIVNQLNEVIGVSPKVRMEMSMRSISGNW
jgi:hypothetical protein